MMDDCKTCLHATVFVRSLLSFYSVVHKASIGVLAIVNWRTKFGEPGNKTKQQLYDHMTN